MPLVSCEWRLKSNEESKKRNLIAKINVLLIKAAKEWDELELRSSTCHLVIISFMFNLLIFQNDHLIANLESRWQSANEIFSQFFFHLQKIAEKLMRTWNIHISSESCHRFSFHCFFSFKILFTRFKKYNNRFGKSTQSSWSENETFPAPAGYLARMNMKNKKFIQPYKFLALTLTLLFPCRNSILRFYLWKMHGMNS